MSGGRVFIASDNPRDIDLGTQWSRYVSERFSPQPAPGAGDIDGVPVAHSDQPVFRHDIEWKSRWICSLDVENVGSGKSVISVLKLLAELIE